MPEDRVEAIRKSLRDGLGIRATARLHKASTTTVTKIAREIAEPLALTTIIYIVMIVVGFGGAMLLATCH